MSLLKTAIILPKIMQHLLLMHDICREQQVGSEST